jgi:hypothetical protein
MKLELNYEEEKTKRKRIKGNGILALSDIFKEFIILGRQGWKICIEVVGTYLPLKKPWRMPTRG